VVLDLARVSTIDAGGFGVMLELRELIQSRGIAFKLMNATNPVSYLLQITCLNSVFEITSGAEIACALTPNWPAKDLAQCA
jgi:anti-anti-sigma factor